jgi:tRNA-Thr(GGU) m(6)t(6)A37 methyltransferase TsaA
MNTSDYILNPIGFVRSGLNSLQDAPMQGDEDAPDAWLDLVPDVIGALKGIEIGDHLLILTWLHKAQRDVLQVHPRDDLTRPLTGVFATRSPDRPNPIGVHRVTVLEVTENMLRVKPLEAINGTPIIDIKPVLSGEFSER